MSGCLMSNGKVLHHTKGRGGVAEPLERWREVGSAGRNPYGVRARFYLVDLVNVYFAS